MIAIGASSSPAVAQPDAPPPDAPHPPEPHLEPDPATLIRAAYEDAYLALLAGNLELAITGFDGVAARTDDPELAAAARALSQLASDLRRRGARIAPSSPGDADVVRVVREAEEPDGGRTQFIVSTTMASLYAGVVADVLMDIDDVRAAVAVVTASTAAGLIGSIRGSKDRRITEAMGDAYTLGMLVGGGNALLLSAPLGLDDEDQVMSVTLGAVVAGGVAGLVLTDRWNPTRGQVSLAGTLGYLGIASVLLGTGVIQPDLDDTDTMLLALAGGLDVGIGLGVGVGKHIDWSVSRSRLVSLGSFVGALGGLATAALIFGTDDDDDTDTILRGYAGLVLGGMWTGFGAAIKLTSGMQPDTRYRATTPAPSTQLVPIALPGGAGLALSGGF